MKGRPRKPPELRQRRNKETVTELTIDGEKPARVPPLPKDYDWHPMTRRWWRELWRSPLAAELLKVDLHALYRLAVLETQFWREPDAKLAAEIRQQEARFGLTPLDRSRLRWEIHKAESTERKTASAPTAPAQPVEDPRAALRIV